MEVVCCSYEARKMKYLSPPSLPHSFLASTALPAHLSFFLCRLATFLLIILIIDRSRLDIRFLGALLYLT